jgi:two-component system, OmpR family, response regulator VanR
MSRILVIEDEADIQNIIKAFLEEAGYEVKTADDGIEGLEEFHKGNFDLVLLDIMLPKIDGFAVCEMIRKESAVPVVILTALDEEQEQLKGFDLKADAYITKPFSLNILLKRVEAVLRRSNRKIDSKMDIEVYRKIRLDKNAVKAFVSGRQIELTSMEFKLLCLLMENRGIVLTRDSILDRLWGYDYYGDARVVDTHIKNLRRKLGVDYIETIRKVGYRFEKD